MSLFKTETIKCAVCKHLVEKADAKVVMEERYYDTFSFFYYSPPIKEKVFFCPEHAPKYDMRQGTNKTTRYFVKMDWLEVNEKGEPLPAKKKTT